MAITTSNINTGGADVTVGGTVAIVDEDGYYVGTTGGTNIGCTTGGVKIAYSYDATDIFCDQTLAPIEAAITNETATVEFEMLETNSDNIRFAVGQFVSSDDADDNKTGIGGLTTLTYYPLMLEIADNDDGTQTRKTTWTFFRTRPQGLESAFERENPTTVKVTFQAYADTSHASGHQLFSINEDLT